MDTLNIDTSQNIDIEQTIASIGERIAATLLDLLFIMCYFIVVIVVYNLTNSATIVTILSIPPSVYSIISESLMNGQSWGKKILKIKVIKLDGTPTTFSSYFLRWVLRLVEILVTFGSLATITIILNRKGQRLGDIAANTVVIRIKDLSLKESIFIQIPDDYKLVYPEVSRLSVNDIYTIKDVLEFLHSPDRNEQTLLIAQKAHQAIERKLNIKTDIKTASFFKTILCDYNSIHSK